MAILSKARSQLDNPKKTVSSKKANKNRLIHLLETAKRALIDSLQGELWDQIESADTKNRVREDTNRQLIWFLRENELHVPRSDDWAEPAIPISVLQSLAKSTQGNLQIVYGLMNKTSKAAQEEELATLELKNCMKNNNKDSQQTNTWRIADIDDAYLALVDLELDNDNIRKEGNIMDYERKTKVPSALHQKRVNNLKDKLEDHWNILRNTCNTAQPTQNSMTQLHYRTVNAREFISDIHDKHSRY